MHGLRADRRDTGGSDLPLRYRFQPGPGFRARGGTGNPRALDLREGTPTPFGVPKTEYAGSELPEWKTMELLADGETHLVMLDKLSVEQRQTLWCAIAKHAHLDKQ